MVYTLYTTYFTIHKIVLLIGSQTMTLSNYRLSLQNTDNVIELMGYIHLLFSYR